MEKLHLMDLMDAVDTHTRDEDILYVCHAGGIRIEYIDEDKVVDVWFFMQEPFYLVPKNTKIRITAISNNTRYLPLTVGSGNDILVSRI